MPNYSIIYYRQAAGAFCVVPHDEARAFYAHFEFEVSPTDPLHPMLVMKDARALIRG